MTATATAATALAAALLLSPGTVHRRLRPTRPRSAARRRRSRLIGRLTGALAVLVLVLLPVRLALAAALLLATVATRYRRRVRSRWAARESLALAAAVEILTGELRVGATPVNAFALAAGESGTAVVAAGLGAVAARSGLGADVAAGLRGAGGPSALTPYWGRLADCWQLAAEHGLAMSTLLGAAQRDIAARQRFTARVTAEMAGTRASAAILAGLPVLGLLLGELIGAAPVRLLLDTTAGGWLTLAGVGLVSAGLLWSDRITEAVTS